MYYEALFKLNNFLLEEEIKWNNLENSLILTEASIVLNEEEEIENSELADKVEKAIKNFGSWLKGLFDKVMEFFSNFINNVEEIFKGIKRAFTDNSITIAMERNSDWKKISVNIADTRTITSRLLSNQINLRDPKGLRVLEETLNKVPMIQLQAVVKNVGQLKALINSTTKAKNYVLSLKDTVKKEIIQSNKDLQSFEKGSEDAQTISKEINEKKVLLMKLVKLSARFANIVRSQYMIIFKFIRKIGKNKEIKSKYTDLERDAGQTKKY